MPLPPYAPTGHLGHYGYKGIRALWALEEGVPKEGEALDLVRSTRVATLRLTI